MYWMVETNPCIGAVKTAVLSRLSEVARFTVILRKINCREIRLQKRGGLPIPSVQKIAKLSFA